MSIRVRYAPSPTGSPHVGNIRDALFKHLIARHSGGTNILRIEDTDRTRYVPGCEEEIVESLQWLGIQFQEGFGIGGDFGPYRQSERKEAGIYAKLADELLERGHAYWAFDTSDELTEMREMQQINKQPIGYFGGVWRDATPEQVEAARSKGLPGVIRQRIPRDTTIVIEDYIRGRLEWDSNTVDDPVLIKADGMPTYHFAAMVDDHLMQISHIMRGEEWISSAPKHACLFDAFGWDRPVFVHCPVIKGKDGSKLSKRHGDTRVLDYRSAGYLPEALVNFVALIGWAPGGDRELMAMPELEEAFTLDGLQPSPGVFDLDKLRWMNGHYMRQRPLAELCEMVLNFARSEGAREYYGKNPEENKEILAGFDLLSQGAEADPALFSKAIELGQERVTTLADFGVATAFFFQEEPPMDQAAVEKWFSQPHVPALFDSLLERLTSSAPTEEECEAAIRDFSAAQGFEKMGPVVHPTRVALTGRTAGPGLFQLMAALGPDRMRKRLERAKTLLP